MSREPLLPRSDLLVGGGEALRLEHALLPEASAAFIVSEGMRLTFSAPPAAALPKDLARAEQAALLARLLGLLAFLSSRGLGFDARALLRMGVRRGDPATPAPADLPVPAWRAAGPALAVAATAGRLDGIRLDAADVRSPAALEESLVAGRSRSPFVVSALRCHREGLAPEVLLADLVAESGEFAPPRREMLGLVHPPVAFEGARASASGAASLWVARGAARRRPGEEGFVEIGAGPALESGGALRRLAGRLGDDPRAAWIGALSLGKRPGRPPSGPPLVVVAREPESWDARSRDGLATLPEAGGLRVVEASRVAPSPWAGDEVLRPALEPHDVAGLVWWPYRSSAEAVASWERLARGVPPGLAEDEPGPRAGRRGGRPAHPVVLACSLLADGFDVAEAAAAGGADAGEARAALEGAEADGTLAAAGAATWAFRDEAERRRLARRVNAASRRDILVRLRSAAVEESRRLAAALSCGSEKERDDARAAFRDAAARGDVATGARLLSRAPDAEPDLGEAWFAVEAHLAARRRDRARESARRLGTVPAWLPASRRLLLARRVADVREPDVALRILGDDGGVRNRLERARILQAAHRDAEAEALLPDAGERETLPTGERGLALVLAAEAATRRGDVATARRELEAVRRLLARESDADLVVLAAFVAGFAESSMGRHDRATAFFALAKERAPDDETRALAGVDLAVSLFHARRHVEADREMDEALAHFEAAGDADRWLSAFGNRADFALRRGDLAGARRALDRVTAHDRASGDGRRLVFALETLQRLCLLQGDLTGAEEAYREAEGTGLLSAHPNGRDVERNEARRLLLAGEPAAALARLGTPRLDDGEARRLAASARLDLDRDPSPPDDDPWFPIERRLRSGAPPPAAALEQLDAGARGKAPAEAASRVFEWALRFPDAMRRPAAAPVLELGRRAARRAGLDALAATLDAIRPAGAAEKTGAPTAAPGARIVAADPDTVEVFSRVARLAPTAIPILVLGESGTGKEIVAREVHRLSGRSGRFVAVNVAALPATLVESELFGHAKGAFTGADRDREGLFEAAGGGTLFLDEIGDLAPAAQAKLLRVLEEKEVRRLGEVASRRVDARVVAATHRNLEERVAGGSFRGDLYYRLARAVVALRPLRERPADLLALLQDALDGRGLSAEARHLLVAHDWPGNVRELRAALELATALAGPSGRILPEHLPESLRRRASPDRSGGPVPTWKEAIDAGKRRAIEAALAAAGGNRTHAAKLLGIARQSLVAEMGRLGAGRDAKP